MSEEKKKCPACAEMIAADASICPFCNEKLQQQSSPPPDFKLSKLKIVAIIGAAILLVILLYYCFADDYTIESSKLQERNELYYEVGEKNLLLVLLSIPTEWLITDLKMANCMELHKSFTRMERRKLPGIFPKVF